MQFIHSVLFCLVPSLSRSLSISFSLCRFHNLLDTWIFQLPLSLSLSLLRFLFFFTFSLLLSLAIPFSLLISLFQFIFLSFHCWFDDLKLSLPYMHSFCRPFSLSLSHTLCLSLLLLLSCSFPQSLRSRTIFAQIRQFSEC